MNIKMIRDNYTSFGEQEDNYDSKGILRKIYDKYAKPVAVTGLVALSLGVCAGCSIKFKAPKYDPMKGNIYGNCGGNGGSSGGGSGSGQGGRGGGGGHR